MAYRQTESRILHTEAIKRKILAAGAELLKGEGMAGLTIRKTIDRASVSNGNFYYYFRDKADLVDHIIQTELEAVGGRIDEAGNRARLENLPHSSILAAMVYSGIQIGLAYIRRNGILFLPELRARAYAKLRPYMIHRTLGVLESMPGVLSGTPPGLAAVLWQGSLIAVLEEQSELEQDASAIAARCAEWNLRAIGLPESEISRSTADAMRVWASVAADGIPNARIR